MVTHQETRHDSLARHRTQIDLNASPDGIADSFTQGCNELLNATLKNHIET